MNVRGVFHDVHTRLNAWLRLKSRSDQQRSSWLRLCQLTADLSTHRPPVLLCAPQPGVFGRARKLVY